MATERQIHANRANAAKSTGPITPEGKRICASNLPPQGFIAGTVVLKGESMRRYNDLAAAVILQFQPRNSAETALVQIMTVARWRLLRIWGIQTAGFELEMARQDHSAGSGAVLAALAFRSLADNSRALALQHRFEATYDRQYRQALAMLLKLRETPDRSWEDDFKCEPNFDPGFTSTPEQDRIDSERVTTATGGESHFQTPEPILIPAQLTGSY
jgi:hypothetical protein